MSKLPDNLLLLRKNKGLTQDDVADYLKLSKTAYFRYENDKAEPNIETLIKLADLYNVTIDQLVGRESKIESTELKDILIKKQVGVEIKEVLKESIKELVEDNEEKLKALVLQKLGIQKGVTDE
jgi:transcriptional regulator with XRE-family HTH domain